jgi:tripartite-type tricarboxylate transporter receptor subunit TctC
MSRRAARAIVLSLVALATSATAHAQVNSTTRPIRLVVGYSAGGAADIVARVLGFKLTEILGQSVYVVDRTGGAGTVATEDVARAEPDGTTLLLTPIANAVNETLFKNFRYKFDEYFTAVAPLAETANVLVVHPSVDVKSVADLIALAKSRPPGSILAGSSGVGTSTHLTNELFNLMAGVKLTSVQYRGGGDVTADLLSGQVKVMFATIPPVLPFIRNGLLRAIATTGPKRDSVLPDLPTIAESGLPGFDVRLWLGISAPARTPQPLVDRLASAIAKALEAPDVKTALAAQDFTPLAGTPQQFATFYQSEVEKWRKVIVQTGMSIE